ncbi:MAG: Gfo/Idh/MocA family oxidoreductase, partial [Candidatus Lokiarchaeota archaeon]|nr:Gfo/Idh/MocA family oxidoreductase [Candidatus Lokiarchaeota archaeon]
MEKLKVGIIGSGFIAEHHALAYSQLQDVDVIGLASVIEDQAIALMKQYKIPGKPLKDYKDLLKMGPDVVSVCLPNYLHKDVTTDVLAAGAHALVEKPLARSVSEGKAMIAAE